MSTFFLSWLIGLTLHIQRVHFCYFPSCSIAWAVGLQVVTAPLEAFSARKLLRLLFLLLMMLRAIWQVIIRTWILADYGVFSPIIAGGFMWATPINVNGTCMCKSSLHQWENWPLKQNICLLDLLIQKDAGTASSPVETCWGMCCFTGLLWGSFQHFLLYIEFYIFHRLNLVRVAPVILLVYLGNAISHSILSRLHSSLHWISFYFSRFSLPSESFCFSSVSCNSLISRIIWWWCID